MTKPVIDIGDRVRRVEPDQVMADACAPSEALQLFRAKEIGERGLSDQHDAWLWGSGVFQS